jgi:hypothetical protein
MNVKNKLWEELKQADANVRCITLYTDRQRRYNRWYQIFIAFSAAIGTVLTQAKPEWAQYSLWLIALVSIAKAVFPSMLHTDQDLFALDGLMDFYNKYKVEMELLFHSFDNEYITDQEALNKLSELKRDECIKQSLLNRMIRRISKKLRAKILKDSEDYLKKTYFDDYDTPEEKE